MPKIVILVVNTFEIPRAMKPSLSRNIRGNDTPLWIFPHPLSSVALGMQRREVACDLVVVVRKRVTSQGLEISCRKIPNRTLQCSDWLSGRVISLSDLGALNDLDLPLKLTGVLKGGDGEVNVWRIDME